MTMGMNSVDVGLPGLLMEMGESLIQDEERTARDGEELMVFASANWESGHDGCGVEVVSAEWLPVSDYFLFGMNDGHIKLLVVEGLLSQAGQEEPCSKIEGVCRTPEIHLR